MQAESLLQLPVLMRGIELGRVVDVILDEAGEQPIGVEVLCRDETHRFLPLVAAQVDEGSIVVDSPLPLLEAEELRFYRKRGRALRSGPRS